MHDTWREWLGEPGSVPPPLDTFLAFRRAERRVAETLSRWCATATLAVHVEKGDSAPGGVGLLDEIRALDPHLIEAVSRGKAGVPQRDRLRASARWDERCVGHGVPAGFGPLLARRAERWGEERALRWLATQGERPPVWLRARDPGAAAELRAEGLEVVEEQGALRVIGRRRIEETAAYRAGKVEIRDLASQLLGARAEPRHGQVAWDVCAGRGGKTVQMADALRGKGSVHATDIDPRKLADLKVRVRRAGLADHVRIRGWDGEVVPDFGPEARRGFDVILVDAPCSSAGTWRRNPDARLRVDPAEAPGRAELQKKLLALAATALRPGGRLVYGTCSWLVEEDEDVAASLPGFVVEDALFGPPEVDADTMYVATLRAAPRAATLG